jgi:transcriptional regulator with XRE-family HTH domain
MSDKIKQVALRIKSLRELSGVSAETLAKKLKISKSQYEKYEKGNTDIPISILYEVAGEFKAELTSLLTGEEPKLREYSVVRNGKGPSVDRRKDYKYQDLAYNFRGKKAEFFLIKVNPLPKTKAPSLNSHAGHEFNYMLEGSMKIILDGHEIIIKEGDSIYFDSIQQHSMTALGGKAAKFLAVIL